MLFQKRAMFPTPIPHPLPTTNLLIIICTFLNPLEISNYCSFIPSLNKLGFYQHPPPHIHTILNDLGLDMGIDHTLYTYSTEGDGEIMMCSMTVTPTLTSQNCRSMASFSLGVNAFQVSPSTPGYLYCHM